MRRNVVISGGFGHVGSQLVKRMSLHNNVTVIDNGLLGRSSASIRDLDITILNDDVANLSHHKIECDYFFHLGEYSRVEQSLNEPSRVFENNTGNIMSVLSFCREKEAKLIYAGSSTKYADGGDAALTNPYAVSKKINTEIVRLYCEFCSVDYAIVYLNNVYGPGESGSGLYATVVEKFLKLKANNKTLAISLPGSQRRAFTHVDDTVAALEMVGKNGKGDGFIICGDKDYSVLEIAKYISDDIKFISSNTANRSGGYIDNSKIKSLGWSPEIDIFDYLDSRIIK